MRKSLEECLYSTPRTGFPYRMVIRYPCAMHEMLTLQTHRREELVDITEAVRGVLERSRLKNGLINVYAQGATAAIMIQENWDDSVQLDVVNFLRKLIPSDVWLHDAQDGNGDAHLKAGLVGPSETIPVIEGQLGLSRWQNIFFCEFDGPRPARNVVCTLISGGLTNDPLSRDKTG